MEQRNMKTITTIFAFFLIAAGALIVSAQVPTVSPKPGEPPLADTKETAPRIEEPIATCDLTIPNSPFIHGLQLGMPEKEASLKLLRTPFEPDTANPGRQKHMSTKLDPTDMVFEHVEAAALRSFDGKVSAMKLTYNLKFPTVKEFIMKHAPKLGVVRIGFRIDHARNEAKMICKDFTVELKAGDASSEITITDIRDPQKNTAPNTR